MSKGKLVIRVTCITHRYPATIIDRNMGVFCPEANPGEFTLYEPNLACMGVGPGAHNYSVTATYEWGAEAKC